MTLSDKVFLTIFAILVTMLIIVTIHNQQNTDKCISDLKDIKIQLEQWELN